MSSQRSTFSVFFLVVLFLVREADALVSSKRFFLRVCLRAELSGYDLFPGYVTVMGPHSVS
jgi:hypothetical protein